MASKIHSLFAIYRPWQGERSRANGGPIVYLSKKSARIDLPVALCYYDLQGSFAKDFRQVEIFEVSADYLLNDHTEDYEVKIQDKSLADRIRLVDALEEDDRKTLVQVIDSMLTKKKVLDLFTKKESFAASR